MFVRYRGCGQKPLSENYYRYNSNAHVDVVSCKHAYTCAVVSLLNMHVTFTVSLSTYGLNRPFTFYKHDGRGGVTRAVDRKSL